MPSTSRQLLPLREMPPIPLRSPEVVRVLDAIRQDFDAEESLAEFTWFAREYPRVYRYHFCHVQLRLGGIYRRYASAHAYFSERLAKEDSNCFSMAIENSETRKVYWDFEAFLSAVSTALDVLARVVATAYAEQTPPSFNRLCKKEHLRGCADILRAARERWVSRMKDYRDCFVHYTCVDTILTFSCNQYANGFELRCRLPTNPNVREILGFRFARRADVLRYACAVYRNLLSLDKAIACQISKEYKSGSYPQRTSNLFFVGSRSQAPE